MSWSSLLNFAPHRASPPLFKEDQLTACTIPYQLTLSSEALKSGRGELAETYLASCAQSGADRALDLRVI
ncbi:MAG: hypothetical protein QXH43_07465 [Metallosphaera sp.]|uniref:hypothetical protein n=1 Tax=Metallosphaera sp. TaxID=2020860 RepID=UPI00317F447B